MVTIYYDTRTVHVRLPVLSLRRRGGGLLVRFERRTAARREALARLHRSAVADRQRRSLAIAQGANRLETHQRAALAELAGRGV